MQEQPKQHFMQNRSIGHNQKQFCIDVKWTDIDFSTYQEIAAVNYLCIKTSI